MPPTSRKTTLDPTPEAVFRKTYSAVIRSDGSLLPIEEKLGRRLLRTLPADSNEGRRLLRKDCVSLTTAEGRALAGFSIEDVYQKLRTQTAQRLAERPRDPDWRRRCQDTLVTIERWYRALARDH
jgi:hypothetical protein